MPFLILFTVNDLKCDKLTIRHLGNHFGFQICTMELMTQPTLKGCVKNKRCSLSSEENAK